MSDTNIMNHRIIRYYLIVMFTLFTIVLNAQHENDTWLFGKGLGMQFRNGASFPLAAPAHASSKYIYTMASISDQQTGQLIFYTNGVSVFNKYHQIVAGSTFSSQNYGPRFFARDPADSLRYYLFYSNGYTLFYDLYDSRGFGSTIIKADLISTNCHDRFTIVRQLYNNGYWLITHHNTDNVFETYRVTSDGVEKKAIISTTTETRKWPTTNTFYNDIAVTTDGKQFAVIDNNGASPRDKFILIYDFDKRCGTVTLNREMAAPTFIYDACYDATGKYLYVATTSGGSNNSICRADLSIPKTTDTLPITPIITAIDPIHRLKLGPDNKIYVTKEELIETGYSPSRYIDVLNNPSSLSGLNYQNKIFNLSPGNQCFNDPCYLTDKFGCFINDRTYHQPIGYEPPIIETNGFCIGVPGSYTASFSNLIFDSLYWDFGDSSRAYSANASHTYSRSGSFIASFNWFTCGLRYHIDRTVLIGAVPNAYLGPDTMLCSGTPFTLQPASTAARYQWSTGDSTATLSCTDSGTYKVIIANGMCLDSDEIHVSYYAPLWTALGTEYYICDEDEELTTLDAGEGFVRYKWTPTGDSTQWIIVGKVGDYFVMVRDFRGCDGSDGTRVIRRCDVALYFPSAFTPNQDGLNDTYSPTGYSITEYHISIYNRWGQCVFKSDEVGRDWDGTFQGIPAPEGVYAFHVTYSGYVRKKPVEFEMSGSFTLLR